MSWPLLISAWLGWGAIFPGLISLSRAVRGTTLVSAARWAWGAAFLLTVSLASAVFAQFPPALSQQLFYWTGIVVLCPLIAVLGAQRPGVRVWNAFVLIPLIAVLGGPALTVWSRGYPPAPLQIETPTAIGIAVVAIMGMGNYVLIPRWSAAVLLYGAAVALLLLPMTALVNLSSNWQLAAYPCAGLCALTGWLSSRRPQPLSDPLEQKWADFRDRFGLVWAVRIKERINATAEKERWCTRLEMPGFRSIAGEGLLSELETRARMEHTLRWLLRRFVDEPSMPP